MWEQLRWREETFQVTRDSASPLTFTGKVNKAWRRREEASCGCDAKASQETRSFHIKFNQNAETFLNFCFRRTYCYFVCLFYSETLWPRETNLPQQSGVFLQFWSEDLRRFTVKTPTRTESTLHCTLCPRVVLFNHFNCRIHTHMNLSHVRLHRGHDSWIIGCEDDELKDC